MRIVMRVLEGPDQGKEFVFETQERFADIVVGRDEPDSPAQWRFSKTNTDISPLHFVLEIREGNCYLRPVSKVFKDMGDLEGIAIGIVKVEDGDRFRLGSTLVELSITSQFPAQPTVLVGSQKTIAYYPASCHECGRDMSEYANLDGRAAELADAALYLCQACASVYSVKDEIGRYQVLKRFGFGISKNFLGRDRLTGRLAVLSLLVPGFIFMRRTDDIIHTLAGMCFSVKHPNIQRIYEIGEHNGHPFVAFEYVVGRDLLQFISDEGEPLLSFKEVIELICEVLLALEYFHRQGYVHRDLKPENILLVPRLGHYVPKIVELNLAANYRIEPKEDDDDEPEFAGTWMYMPPEQIVNFKRVKPQADIYAMGVTTYFLLSGYWPLPDFPTYAQIKRGRVAALPRTPIQMILHDRRVPLEERRPELPRALCRVVNKAIAMRPEDRYQTAEEFRQALLKSI